MAISNAEEKRSRRRNWMMRAFNYQYGAGGAAFPVSLFGAGVKGVIFDPTSFSNMFQDSARTTPVTALGDPVGSITDLSPNAKHAGQATANNRPLIQSDGNNRHLDFDGTNDALATAAIDFTGTDKLTAVYGVRVDAGTTTRNILELSATIVSNAGSFRLGTRSSNDGDLVFSVRGATQITGYQTLSAALPRVAVASCVFDIAGADRATEVFPRVNGAIPTLQTSGSADATGGNFGNYAFNIGARAGSSLFLDGGLYRLLVIGRALTAQEIVQAESWVAQGMGITL